MTPSKLGFYLLCGAVAQITGLHSGFLSATVGDKIILPCSSEDDAIIGAKTYWYKQSLGMKPVLISSFFIYDQRSEFHGEFQNDRRFTQTGNNLYINNVEDSDSAVYHCLCGYLHQTDFLESITVIVNGLNSGVEVHQSSAENIDPGASITLKCTVHTGSCDGAHRVSWFKKTEDSHAGVLYSHGDQCERNTDNKTDACAYNLPIHNVSSEQTGTYYCAVASCGQVLFGNGTRVNVKSGLDNLHYVLSGALVFSFSLVAVLAFCLCWKNITGTCARNGASSANTKGFPKLLQYMAMEQVTRGQLDDTWSECIYFSVEQ